MSKPFGFCRTPYIDGPLTPEGCKALASIGINAARLTPPLWGIFTDPDFSRANWARLDHDVKCCRDAGIDIYMNPGGCPRFASEGQPAYEEPLVSSIAFDDPIHGDPLHVHRFDQTPGSKFYEIDRLQSPRPWTQNPPHIDPLFMRSAARAMAARYRSDVKWWGIWNEYGDKSYVLQMALDSVSNDPPGPEDVIQTRIMPEIVRPWFLGIVDALGVAQRFSVGPDADSDIIMKRCLEETAYDFVGAHPYGDPPFNGGDYALTERFTAVFVEHSIPFARRWCSEIGGEPAKVLRWIRESSDWYSAVFMMPATIWFEPGTFDTDRPVVSEIGHLFAAEFAKVNGPVDPIRTTMPVRKRAARSRR